MVKVVATADQAKLLAESTDCVEIVDADGKRLGTLLRPLVTKTFKSLEIVLQVTVNDTQRRKSCRVSAR